jgi:hypothetical protein
MATTTPNNGWAVPTSTDYVKDGATAIETLGDAIDASVGTGLLAWISYTPTFTNLTVGNGTLTSKYCIIGKTMFLRFDLVGGSTSTITGVPTVTLPSGVTTSMVTVQPVGVANVFQAGNVPFSAVTMIASSTTITPYLYNSTGTYSFYTAVASGVPATFGNGHILSMRATIEVN